MPSLLEPAATRDIVTPMSLRVESMSGETRRGAAAQQQWAARPTRDRLRVIKQARHLLAERTDAFCAAIPAALTRNAADTMCAEILPLLSAFEFLEREAEGILRLRVLGKQGRPLWLIGVWSEVHRVPMGRVLVIAPSNYPLFLPGVQVVQALVAGNSAIWKPAPGGTEVANLFAEVMRSAGLPDGLLEVTDDSVEAAKSAIDAGVDKVFFTGSATSGRALLKHLAQTLTPCVAELSGCDSVFVLPSADLSRVVKALTFGMRLNGSATCMAPRRVLLIGASAARKAEFQGMLVTSLDAINGVNLSQRVKQELHSLLTDAALAGASVHGEASDRQQPVLVSNATPEMRVAQADIFEPMLVTMNASDADEALAINQACPYALTAAIFGNEREAFALAAKVVAGTVMVNDLMVPAADPRTPFGGRRNSGFGVTQGAEGLLEMTAPKTIAVRQGSNTNHYDATTLKHERLFRGIITASHRSGWRQRIAGLKEVLSAANDLK